VRDYKEACAIAQAKANATGYDHGLELNKLFKEWAVFMLPTKANRYGRDARCEVVSCERIANCKPGHGPA